MFVSGRCLVNPLAKVVRPREVMPFYSLQLVSSLSSKGLLQVCGTLLTFLNLSCLLFFFVTDISECVSTVDMIGIRTFYNEVQVFNRAA